MDEATVFVSSSLRLIDSWKTTALCFLFPGCFHFFFGPTVAVKCKVPYIANFRNNCASWACLLYLRQTSWLNHNVPHSHFLFFSLHVTAHVRSASGIIDVTRRRDVTVFTTSMMSWRRRSGSQKKRMWADKSDVYDPACPLFRKPLPLLRVITPL